MIQTAAAGPSCRPTLSKRFRMSTGKIDYQQLSHAVVQILQTHQAALNEADTANQNHGDHMLTIWQAIQAQLSANPGEPVPVQLHRAAASLAALPANGSAEPYRKMLADLAEGLESDRIDESEVLRAASRLVNPTPEVVKGTTSTLGGLFRGMARRAGGLVNLNQMAEQMGVGNLFESGLNLLNGANSEGVLLEAAVTMMVQRSELAGVPHRAYSGKLVLRTLILELDRQAQAS